MAQVRLGLGLLGLGLLAFLSHGAALVAGPQLPTTLGWPVGSTDHAIQTSDGHVVVPWGSIERIQLYDPELCFARG